MGFRNRGPKRRWGWGWGSLAEYCGGWGETQKEDSFVANKFQGHTPSRGLGKKPREKLRVSESLRVPYPSLANLFSLPLYINLQACLAWLALHRCFELRLRKALEEFCKSIKDFFRPKCRHSPADNTSSQLYLLRPCGLSRIQR